MPSIHLTADQLDRLGRVPDSEIAAEVGCSRGTIYRLRRRQAVKPQIAPNEIRMVGDQEKKPKGFSIFDSLMRKLVKVPKEAAHAVAMEHPELGLDPDDTDTPAAVWELIREGKQDPPAMHSPEVAKLAAQWVKPAKKVKAHDDWDAVPFSRSSHEISEPVR